VEQERAKAYSPCQRALKGQKLIAQGSALGMNTNGNHALKGQQKRQPKAN
jgi:hypothetical protein